MKIVFTLSGAILLAACSSPDPELVQYCDYQKRSFAISKAADEQSLDNRDQWVKEEHQKLHAELRITDSVSFEQNAMNNGWLPLICKEKGLW